MYYDARELCILEPAAHTDELITLTLASMEPRFIRDAVIDFNASNGKYAVEIIDYSQYNTDDAPEAGVFKAESGHNLLQCAGYHRLDQFAAGTV